MVPFLFVVVAQLGSNLPATSPSSVAQAHEGWIVTADSVKLYYRVIGSGAQTVIVPLASYFGTSLDSLARRGHRMLVLYDPRGRGRSDTVPASKVSLEHNLRDLDAIRSAAGAERVAIIGWSGFGMETFVYALHNPKRVTRLIQLAPIAPRWTPYSDSMMADRARRTNVAEQGELDARLARSELRNDGPSYCRAVAAVTLPPTFIERDSVNLVPDICDYPTEWPDRIGAYFRAFQRSIEGFDWRDSLSRLASLPRLVIHGERDNTPIEGNLEWVAGQPNARLLVISGAGHWPHYENPKQTIAAMDRFLRGEWPVGSQASDICPVARRCGP